MIAVQKMYLERFCRQVETRSKEFQNVMPILIEHRAWITAGSHTAGSAICRCGYGRQVSKSVQAGGSGHGDGETADEKVPALQNSVLSIYKLGCKLVHLSSAHDYEHSDPYHALPVDARRELILDPLLAVWGSAGITTDSTFAEVMEYASPLALRKLTELVDVSVERLRADERLDPTIGIQPIE